MSEQPGTFWEPPGDAGSSTSAGLGWRFLARLLDAAIVGLALSGAAALLGLPAPTLGLGGMERWMTSAVTAVVWCGYYVVTESGLSTTLGKRIVGLRVVGVDGRRPSVTAAGLRNMWILFGLVPWVGGLALLAAIVVIAVTIARSTDHRGQHDRLAGTVVERRVS